MVAVCTRCGAEKELPLARCPGCGHTPLRSESALALLASTRMLAEAELSAVQARIQRGEQLRPSKERLAAAEQLLKGGKAPAPRALDRGEAAGLFGLSVLFTPIVALLASWAWRDTPAGRTALWVAAGSAVVLGGLWVALLVA